jgi:hypothetical protein
MVAAETRPGSARVPRAKSPIRIAMSVIALLLRAVPAQLLAKGNDLDTEVVAGTEKGLKAFEQGSEKWNHRPGFISQGTMAALL